MLTFDRPLRVKGRRFGVGGLFTDTAYAVCAGGLYKRFRGLNPRPCMYPCYTRATLIPNFTFGWVLIIRGWTGSGEPFVLTNLLLGLLFLFLGAVLTFTLFSLPLIISLWVVRVEKLNGFLSSLWDFNNMPMNNYPLWMRRIGLFVLPVFAITNPAAFTFLGKGDFSLKLAAVGAPLVLGAVVRYIWTKGLRQYHSAGS